MALRFRRRIRIAPGISLNLSKSGIGASIGPRGAKISVGSRGVYANVGLPGTGLAFREKLNKRGSPGATSARAGALSRGKVLEQQLKAGGSAVARVRVNEDGEVVITDDDGQPYDETELRVLRKYAGEGIRDMLQQACDRLNADLAALATVHLDTLPPRDTPVFQARAFPEPEPQRRPRLKPTLWSRIWPPARRRLEEQNERWAEQYARDLSEWEDAARAFNDQERQRRVQETELVLTSLDAMANVLEEHLGEIPWPRETNVSFDLGDDASTIAIDIELPEEDAFPDVEYHLAAKQAKVSIKKVAATRRRMLYRDYAHGVAMRVLGEIFHRLPTVQVALVSAYMPSLDAGTGQPTESYLYSVLVTKSQWREINFKALADIEPPATLERFELRRKMTKTGVFKPIEPLGLEVLEKTSG
ncbi:DUF4236 domain-containing protein [Billgrantia aerodenitrificans]|uniref:DUF4236 domain-containing protein n=1 Tax=Billgrantia aerodenitrificans TaxID=2733483 RepID=A0ABS9ATN0_9GAMM|nr:DUF4236 domain-containing protein [Halomonas aerodenitrificans]MCE8025241.1 DUF4236 domain-containing protein [Halomonas aerodenitrificans]